MHSRFRTGTRSVLGVLLAAVQCGLSAQDASVAEISPAVLDRVQEIARRPALLHEPAPAPVDVEHYVLDLTLEPVQKLLRGRTTVRFRSRETPRTSLVLDAEGLEVQSVRDAGGEALAFQNDGTRLTIELREAAAVDVAAEVVIEYRTVPRSGLFFVQEDRDSPPSQVWSQGQSEMARAWFPCIDRPDERASWQLLATVPEEWRTVSNGVLEATAVPRPGWRTDRWSFPAEAPAYLVSLVAGNLEEVALGSVRGVELLAYCDPSLAEHAAELLGGTGRVLTLLEELTGVAYPYPVYRQSLVSGFPYGGMENVTASTLHDDALVAPPRTFLERRDFDSLVVHELAHQWWGNSLTCARWADLWLNEGFATFAELHAVEQTRGKDEGLAFLHELRTGALEERQFRPRPMVQPRYRYADELFDASVYESGACFLAFLRDVVGTGEFHAALRSWTAGHLGRSVTSAQFEAFFDAAVERELAPLFRDWLHSPGVPELQCSWRFDRKESVLTLTARQVQEGGAPPVYRFPLDVAVHDAAGRRTLRWELDAREASLRIPCDERPWYVRFNEEDAVPAVLAVHQRPQSWCAELLRDPDVLGRRLAAEELGILAAAQQELPADRRLEADELLEVQGALCLAAVQDSSALVRAEAAWSLAALGGDVARQALAAALWDRDERVRRAAVEALGQFEQDLVAVGTLVEVFLTAPDESVQEAALLALSAADPDSAGPWLAQLLEDDVLPEALRGAALEAAAACIPGTALRFALSAVKPRNPPALRERAVLVLGELRDEHSEALDALLTLLEDPSLRIQYATLEALDGVTDARALPALVAFEERAPVADMKAHVADLFREFLADR